MEGIEGMEGMEGGTQKTGGAVLCERATVPTKRATAGARVDSPGTVNELL